MNGSFGRQFEKSRNDYMMIPNHYGQGLPPGSHPYAMFKPNHIPRGWNPLANKNYFDQGCFIDGNVNPLQLFKQPFKKMNIFSDPKMISNSNYENMSGLKRTENVDTTKIKEKTPMCLVNELARYNKIEHKYVVKNEEGPAHKKVFFVSLKLGDDTFSSSGQSIKKAQHAAALEALSKSSYPRPPVKSLKILPTNDAFNQSITPTVELNALAMKRGETVSYVIIGGYKSKPASDDRQLSEKSLKLRLEKASSHLPLNDISRNKGSDPAFIVELSFGGNKYSGEGYSVKAARHSAAKKVLLDLKKGCGMAQDSDPAPVNVNEVAIQNKEDTSGIQEFRGNVSKSEISQVHEIVYKRKLTVNFEITGESGPPHMRVYTTTCTCGHLEATGEGHSKQTSKRKSAENMLEELSKLSPLPPSETNSNRFKTKTEKHKKNRKMIFETSKASPDYGAGINPISRLIQIQQAKKQLEPTFSMLEERGKSRDKEFHFQVTVGDKSCSAWATSKKLAKRDATERLLQLLGYSNSTNQPKLQTLDKKVAFNEPDDQAKPATSCVQVSCVDDKLSQSEMTPKSSVEFREFSVKMDSNVENIQDTSTAVSQQNTEKWDSTTSKSIQLETKWPPDRQFLPSKAQESPCEERT